jgi:predicted ribosomally synthesized peptide with nif11-like leader
MTGSETGAFLEALMQDKALQEELKNATDADAAMAIAKQAGYAISLETAKEVMGIEELSEEDLECIAGGRNFTPLKRLTPLCQ